MQCPRLNHFIRFNTNGTVSRCGHMVSPPQFDTLADMEDSTWLINTQELMHSNQWPAECRRCEEIEQQGQISVRQHAVVLDHSTLLQDYLQVGGVLDNLCNAACQSCSANHSTRIGSLSGLVFPIVNNSKLFWSLPQHRIAHLDINGGEPSYSKSYKHILQNLPPNLQTLRLNTNCSTVLTELEQAAQQGIEVTVTVSCDGIGPVHELTRWPISWQTFYNNLMQYKTMPVKLNLWTTVSVLNVDDLANIQAFAKEHGIDHSWAYLKHPVELCVDNLDIAARDSYILKQKTLRGIV